MSHLKVMGWNVQVAMWWGDGPCDLSVSPSPFGLDFGILDIRLGLDNSN